MFFWSFRLKFVLKKCCYNPLYEDNNEYCIHVLTYKIHVKCDWYVLVTYLNNARSKYSRSEYFLFAAQTRVYDWFVTPKALLNNMKRYIRMVHMKCWFFKCEHFSLFSLCLCFWHNLVYFPSPKEILKSVSLYHFFSFIPILIPVIFFSLFWSIK